MLDPASVVALSLVTGNVLVVEVDDERGWATLDRWGVSCLAFVATVAAQSVDGRVRTFHRKPGDSRLVRSQRLGPGLRLYGAGAKSALSPTDGWQWELPPWKR